MPERRVSAQLAAPRLTRLSAIADQNSVADGQHEPAVLGPLPRDALAACRDRALPCLQLHRLPHRLPDPWRDGSEEGIASLGHLRQLVRRSVGHPNEDICRHGEDRGTERASHIATGIRRTLSPERYAFPSPPRPLPHPPRPLSRRASCPVGLGPPRPHAHPNHPPIRPSLFCPPARHASPPPATHVCHYGCCIPCLLSLLSLAPRWHRRSHLPIAHPAIRPLRAVGPAPLASAVTGLPEVGECPWHPGRLSRSYLHLWLALA